MSTALAIPASIDAVSDAWLAAALELADVHLLSAEPFGDGHLSDTFLITLAGARWPALVLKLAAVDEGSRATAARHRAYEVEVGFYRELAGELGVHVPRCHWAAYEPDGEQYGLLLEHIVDAAPGDQLEGCTAEQAAATLAELARLHAPRWADDTLRQHPWIERHGAGYRQANVDRAVEAAPRFMARYGERLSSEVAALVERFAMSIGRYDRRGQDGPRTIVHGDLRADNLMLGPRRAWLVDWQTALLGHGLVDVSYFLGTSLTVDRRRAHEEALVRGYHDQLVEGGVPLAWEDCWKAYRRYALEGLAMVVIAGPSVKRNERGDSLFASWAERAGRQALDLDAERLMDG